MTEDIFSKIVTALHEERVLDKNRVPEYHAYIKTPETFANTTHSKQQISIDRDWTKAPRTSVFHNWSKGALYNYIFEGVYISKEQCTLFANGF